MKNVILCLFLLCFNRTSFTQFSLDHYHPLALIAEEQIDTCSVFALGVDSVLTIEQSYIYDTMGREIENRRDFQKFSFIYHYNQNLVSEYFLPFGDEFYERDTLIYDKKGRLIKRITFNKHGIESKRNEYVYKDTLVKTERYIFKGNLQTESNYQYSSNNRALKIQKFFRGKHNEDWLHIYDLNGNLLSFKTVAVNGDTTLAHQFEYNDDGLQISQAIYIKGKVLNTIFITKYDGKGLISSKETITDIKNNDPSTGAVETKIYKYTYR